MMGQPSQLIDMIGFRTERAIVIARGKNRTNATSARWTCLCDCGREFDAWGASLRSGSSRSCGCLTAELRAARLLSHGHSRKGQVTRTYRIWKAMHNRCTNQKIRSFKDYGGRGISICERWRSYANFLADMGECPPDRSIDRIDNDGNYEPGNCRWATTSEQNANQRKPIVRARHTHCRRGHEFTEANSKWRMNRRMGRMERLCRTCQTLARHQPAPVAVAA